MGDLCYVNYGSKRGGKGSRAYNQVIHGGHYYLQQEWSNDDHRCASRDETYRVSFSAASSATTVRFSARGRDPDGKIRAYRWYFGDGSGGHRGSPTHTYRRAGSYRVRLRITDSNGNWAVSTRTIRVR